jgi:Asp-tRNA(Asn)/Glu-tRNA(Gln) amidotransferase B subunit
MMAIEGFVLEHWDELEYLQDKKDYEQVSEQFINRVAKLAEKNRTRLEKSLHSNEEMTALLQKAKSGELSATEKEEVRKRLIEVLKAIPTFVIISLPQKFLTLPMLLKILPKNLFVQN